MPARFDARIKRRPDSSWCIEQFLACDCPDCERDGHWWVVASYGTRSAAEDELASRWLGAWPGAADD